MYCEGCGADNAPGARFCLSCGAVLAMRCPHCGSELPAGARFCPSCGQAIMPATAESSPRFAGGERKRSEEHTSELQSHSDLVCRLLLEKKKKTQDYNGDQV